MSPLEQFAQAIASMEGFFRPGTVAQVNNNPGNLRQWGARPTRKGYAQFDTEAAGWKALESQIQLNANRGLTIREFFGGKPGVYAGYSPAADSNDPENYARFVAQRMGVTSIDLPVSSLLRSASPQTRPAPVPGELVSSWSTVSVAGPSTDKVILLVLGIGGAALLLLALD